MLRLKGCGRCGGDLYEEHGLEGVEALTCLQCGRTHYQRTETALQFALAGRRSARVGNWRRAEGRTKLSA
jgi:hypothetical protein